MRMSYRIYSVLITLVSFSYYTGPTHPYMGLLRHLYLAFPVFIGAAPILNRPWKRALTLGLSFIGSMYLVMVYVLEAWVP